MESTKLVTDNEIRADFAQKLTRRFEAMAKSWRETVAAGEGRVHETAPDHWEQAVRVVALTLADENGEDDDG